MACKNPRNPAGNDPSHHPPIDKELLRFQCNINHMLRNGPHLNFNLLSKTIMQLTKLKRNHAIFLRSKPRDSHHLAKEWLKSFVVGVVIRWSFPLHLHLLLFLLFLLHDVSHVLVLR